LFYYLEKSRPSAIRRKAAKAAAAAAALAGALTPQFIPKSKLTDQKLV
jgi:hypothetical protein